MTKPAGSPLKSVAWFPTAGPPKREGGVVGSIVKLGVGGAVGLLFWQTHRPAAAYAVWAIAGVVGGASIVSPAARKAIDGAFARFGRGVGTVVGAVVLTITYVLVVTPTRYVRRALGADDLHLRDSSRQSYWLPCDDADRKVRYAGTMFATEARRAGGYSLLGTAGVLLATLFTLALIAEGVARMFGFGHPVLYVADPDIGYYPEPNVAVSRYGGKVSTNRFGMRSPDVTKEKPAGTFRILMLGDSTLYGGSYIDQDDLYATHVGKELNETKLPGRVEILSMGCNGWGPFHERGFVHKFGNFEADLVLVQLPIDDVNRPLYGLMSVPFFPVQSPPRIALEEFVNHFMWRYRSAHSGLDDNWEAQQSQYGIAEYGNLVDDLHKLGSEVMVFVLPTRGPGLGGHENDDEKKWLGQFETTITAHGVKSYFAKGWFAGKGAPDEIYYDSVHLNPKGHHAYAKFIEGKIQEDSVRFRKWTAGEKVAPAPAQPAMLKPVSQSPSMGETPKPLAQPLAPRGPVVEKK